MKIPFDVDTAAVRAAMEALRRGEPLPPSQVPEGLTKLAVIGAWSHIANSPQFSPAINAAMCIERRMAQLSALLGTYDTEQLRRNIGMRRPGCTLDDIARAYESGELQWLIDEVREYERRLDYVCRRYAMNGKFDLE